jgi:Flp pilus assembly protein TadD
MRHDTLWEADHVSLARALYEGGDARGALIEFRKLSEALPDQYGYTYDVGRVYELIGDSDSARVWYRRAEAIPGADEAVREAALRVSPAPSNRSR